MELVMITEIGKVSETTKGSFGFAGEDNIEFPRRPLEFAT
jgi:hypothetical protein